MNVYRNVQIDLLNAHTYGVPWAEMARDSGLCASTIKNFAEGVTGRPSFQTVSWLAEYAGYKVEVARVNHSSAHHAQTKRTNRTNHGNKSKGKTQ